MSEILALRNRNFRLLLSAGTLSNLGDGLALLALPWFATLISNDPLAVGGVAAAGRLPWLFFAIPVGVIIDRADLRKLIARTDLLRAAIVASILLLALSETSAHTIWQLTALAFLLGTAEVLRDNAAQTILPSLVDQNDLEKANGQMYSAEQLTGEFIGPPLAGALIAMGIAIPFGLQASLLLLSAGLVWMISLTPRVHVQQHFVLALKEGIAFMKNDSMLLRLALVLGCANFISTATITIQVFLAQDILNLSAALYGLVLSVAAAGAVTGSLMAPSLIHLFGAQTCLYMSVGGWAIGYFALGLSQSGITMAAALFWVLAAAMVWNVITVSWRQRRIPEQLLGRVNSIYRFFGWGSMPLGALFGSALVALLEETLGRDIALRTTFLICAALCALLLVYVSRKLHLTA